MKKYFITGISTEVGKTVAAAIVTEALQADYWKPIQAGELDNSDTHKVERFISNSKSVFHQNSYALETPMSPHAAAKIDGIKIELKEIIEPKTNMILPLLLSPLLFILAIIHFNWVLGGSFGFEASLQTTENGKRVLNPKTLDSAIVGLGLFAFGFFYLFKSDLIQTDLFPNLFVFGGWLIPIIFLLRQWVSLNMLDFLKRSR